MLGDALGTAANLSIIVGGVIGLVAATWNLVHRIDMVMLKVEGLERSLKNLPCHEGGCACRKEHR